MGPTTGCTPVILALTELKQENHLRLKPNTATKSAPVSNATKKENAGRKEGWVEEGKKSIITNQLQKLSVFKNVLPCPGCWVMQGWGLLSRESPWQKLDPNRWP